VLGHSGLGASFFSDTGTADHVVPVLASAGGGGKVSSLPETGRMGEAPSVISGESRLAFGGSTGSVPTSFLASGTGAVVGSGGGAGGGGTLTAEGGGGVASPF